MPTSDTDFDAYLSYLHIVSGKCLINGKPEYSFDLPKELSTTSLENLVYKRCEELKIDYVSPSNVHDRVIEAIRDYNQHKLDKKESNGDKDRGLTPSTTQMSEESRPSSASGKNGERGGANEFWRTDTRQPVDAHSPDKLIAAELNRSRRDMPFISVADALRENEGWWTVSGTTTSMTKPFKMIHAATVTFKNCGHDIKEVYQKPALHSLAGTDISSILSGLTKKCPECGEPSSVEVKPEYITAVMADLQDFEAYNEMERLPVFVFGNDTRDIRVGERVNISGEISVMSLFKGGLKTSVLYANSISYENRQELLISNEDRKNIELFVEKHGKRTVDALASMFAQDVIGYTHVKRGLILSAASTSTEVGYKHRRINALLVGEPGLAKSLLAKRAVSLVPGSFHESAQNSSGKSLTALIAKEDNGMVTLHPGPAVMAKGGICSLDEIGHMPYDQQSHLLNIAQEGEFTVNKYGMHVTIKAPSVVIATANPSHIDWSDDDRIDPDEIPVLKPLMDRLDLTFVFRSLRDEKSIRELANGLSELENNETADNTDYLMKHIAYAKTFNPSVSDEAKSMLDEYYIKIARNFGSPRKRNTIYKIAKTIAALKLKNIVEIEDAEETQEFYNVILQQYQQVVSIVKNPSDVAVQECIEMLKFLQWPVSFDELLKTVCKNNAQVAKYLGENFTLSRNWRARNVLERLLNHSHVKRVKEKPVTVQWIKDDSKSAETVANDGEDQKDEGSAATSATNPEKPVMTRASNQRDNDGYEANEENPNGTHDDSYRAERKDEQDTNTAHTSFSSSENHGDGPFRTNEKNLQRRSNSKSTKPYFSERQKRDLASMNEASRRFSRLDKDAKLELLIKAQRDLDTIHRTKWYGDDEGLTQYYKEKFGFYYAQLSETLTLACDEGIVTEWITPSALASPYYLFNYDAAQKFEEELIRKRKIRDQNDGANV